MKTLHIKNKLGNFKTNLMKDTNKNEIVAEIETILKKEGMMVLSVKSIGKIPVYLKNEYFITILDFDCVYIKHVDNSDLNYFMNYNELNLEDLNKILEFLTPYKNKPTLCGKGSIGHFRMGIKHTNIEGTEELYRLFRLNDLEKPVGAFRVINNTRYIISMFNTTQIIELTKEEFTIED